MSETLERGAEILKLARVLEVDAAELAFLDELPSDALRRFRAQVTDRLFGGDAGQLRRVALSSRLLPIPLIVKVSQVAFGPMLCAAAAGLLEPDRAARIASRVPVPFLGDIAVHLDPRRAADVIAAVPARVVVDVAEELLRRGEHVTMGRFVNVLPKSTLAVAVPQIGDDADLLRVAFVMEGKDHLDDLLDVARGRVLGLIRTAYEHDLWAEALDLISHLNVANRAELGDIAATQDDELLGSLVAAAQRMGVWDDLLPVIAAMSTASLQRLAAVPSVLASGVLRDIVAAAVRHDIWLDLLPLSQHLDAGPLAEVAAAAAEQDDAVLEHLASTAHDAGMWDAMLPIALALPAGARRRLAQLPLLAREDVLAAIVATVARTGAWDDVLPLVEVLPAAALPRLAASIGALDRDQMLAGLTAAARTDTLPTLVEIVLGQDVAGRERVLELVAEAGQLDEFTRLLTRSTPDAVWQGLVDVRHEMPDAVRVAIRTRAASLNKADVVASLTPNPAQQRRPRPRPRT